MKIFKDRKAAGKILAARLENIKADFVLGIPRGGVVVASEVAKKLNLPLDVIVTRKIGAPNQPELALGAIDPDKVVVGEGEAIEEEWKELKRREELYTHTRSHLSRLKGKKAILVDDGIATGATALAAVRYLKRHGAKIILAVPVASQEAVERLKKEADQVIVLNIPEFMNAVGQFYTEFLPVSDQEVIQLLNP